MLTVTPAAPSEIDTVVGILAEASRWLETRGYKSWNPDTLPLVMTPSVARGEVYLARLNDQPVGTVTVQWADPAFWGERPDDAGYIHKLAIVRAVAGQRIGAQIVAWAEGLIAERGRSFARLDCQAENPTINAFYEAAGYQLRGSVNMHGMPFNLREKSLK